MSKQQRRFDVVDLVNFTPNKIVTYSQLEGWTRRNKALPALAMPQTVESPTIYETRLSGWSENMSATDLEDWFAKPVEWETIQVASASLANLSDNDTKGALSIAAKKRLRTKINWLFVLSDMKTVKMPDTRKTVRFRLSMLTLTLCSKQMHDDKFIKSQMLNKLLEKLRYNCGMKAYLWRAERQKNGNIHFHITTNIYVHHADLRRYWNDIQSRYGYVDEFEKSNGHRDPNSTDVHSIYKIKNLARYLCKYMSKESDKDLLPIGGRQWFCSTALSKIEPINQVNGGSLRRELDIFLQGKKRLDFDYAQVFYADIFTANLHAFPTLNQLKLEALQRYKPLVN